MLYLTTGSIIVFVIYNWACYIAECSERLIPSIAWHKSTITRSPSCRSLLSSSSRSSFTWTGINSNSDIFDETGGMESGSHLSTLGRLYAWEKKLYEEVKVLYTLDI